MPKYGPLKMTPLLRPLKHPAPVLHRAEPPGFHKSVGVPAFPTEDATPKQKLDVETAIPEATVTDTSNITFASNETDLLLTSQVLTSTSVGSLL